MPLLDLAIPTITFIFVVFFVGGTIKGTLGIGMPTFIIPIVATVLDPVTIIALLFLPILITNFIQMREGGYYWVILRRFKSLLASMLLATIIGVHLLMRIDRDAISLILGCIVVIFCTLQLLQLRPKIPRHREAIFNPIVGTITGIVNGLSTLCGPPLTMYFIALRLPKPEFIATISQFFFITSAALYFTLATTGVLTTRLALESLFVTLPVIGGLLIGRKIRNLIVKEQLFQRLLLVVLLAGGLNLVRLGVY